MQPENVAEALDWLMIAGQDIQTAEYLLEGGEVYARSAAFHCQQTIEKVLKAYLAYRNQPFPRTHDLTLLRDLCQNYDPNFAVLGPEFTQLTTYAVDVRYPGPTDLPTLIEMRQMVEIARQAYDFVTRRIPTA